MTSQWMPWEANARAANPGGDPDHNCLGEELVVQLGEPTVLDVVIPNTKGEPGAQPQMLSATIEVKLAACFNRKASLNDATLDSAFLNAVSDNQHQPWMATVQIGQQRDVKFKLNTGAEVTAINLETFNKLQKVQLCQPSKALYGPAHQRLKVAGQCTIQLTHEGNSSNEEVFIMEDLKNCQRSNHCN